MNVKMDEANRPVQVHHPKRFWTNPKVEKYFLALCNASTYPAVNWKKFHELDKKGVFAKFPKNYLGIMAYKYRNKNNIARRGPNETSL
jgi:hypothetical protein